MNPLKLVVLAAALILAACGNPVEERASAASSTASSTSEGTATSTNESGTTGQGNGTGDPSSTVGSTTASPTTTNTGGGTGHGNDTSTVGTTGQGNVGTTGEGNVGTTGEGNGSTTGTGCAERCTTVADCPADPDATSITCGDDGMCHYVDSFPTTGTGTGGALCATSGGTGSTGQGACACSADADCNDANHLGFVCQDGFCTFGGGEAVGTSGGGCAHPSGGTTGQGNGGTIGTPLVLSFGGAPVVFTRAAGHFELGQGPARGTDWVSAATPWLALDLDGNGRIDSGAELFGSLTRLPGGDLARNGFQALAALDANRDGVIDARDPAFAHLRLWRDANQDRRSQPGELTALRQAGVSAIDLGYATRARCDARGNCERERARVRFTDASGRAHQGSVVDVYLAFRTPARVSMR